MIESNTPILEGWSVTKMLEGGWCMNGVIHNHRMYGDGSPIVFHVHQDNYQVGNQFFIECDYKIVLGIPECYVSHEIAESNPPTFRFEEAPEELASLVADEPEGPMNVFSPDDSFIGINLDMIDIPDWQR